MKSWRQRFLDSRIITWQAYALTAAFTVLWAPELVMSIDSEEDLLRRAAFAAGNILAGLLLLVANQTYLRAKTVGQATFASIATVVAASITFVVTIRILSANLLHVHTEPNIFLRMVNGAIVYSAWLIVISIFVSETRRYRSELGRLELEIETGQSIELDAISRLENLRAKVASQVTAALNRAFANLADRNKLHHASAELSGLIDEVIKPLSESLSKREPDQAELETHQSYSKSVHRISFMQVVRTIAKVRPFEFRVAPVALVLVSTFTRYWDANGLAPVIILAISWITMVTLMVGGTWLHRTFQPRLHEFIWLALAVTYMVFSAVVYALVTQRLFEHWGWTRFLGLVFAGCVVMFSSALGFGVSLERQRVIAELESATAKVAWMNARLGQLIWVEKRRLSRLVHGDIQSRIIATALSIELLSQSPEEVEGALETLRNRCQAALLAPVEGSSLEEFISSLKSLWSVSLDIDNRISANLMADIQSDPILVDTLIECIREAVTNAAKHAKAKRITIDAHMSLAHADDQTDSRRLVLRISNVGKSPEVEGSIETGQGSIMFAEVSLAWSLRATEDGAMLTAEIPMR